MYDRRRRHSRSIDTRATFSNLKDHDALVKRALVNGKNKTMVQSDSFHANCQSPFVGLKRIS